MVETIHVRGEGGAVIEMALPLSRHIEDRLKRGHIRRVNADGSTWVAKHAADEVLTLPESRPALNAPKADWVGWAVANGEDVDKAEAATKQDLIEKYGAAAAAD